MLGIGVAYALCLVWALVVLAAVFTGISAFPDAVAALIKGEVVESRGAMLALLALGWIGGIYAGPHLRQGRGLLVRTTGDRHNWALVILSAAFMSLLIYRQVDWKSGRGLLSALLDAAPGVGLGMAAWFFVVAMPWRLAHEADSRSQL
jgi:hypothetical protein